MDRPTLKGIADNPDLLKAVKEVILEEFTTDIEGYWVGDIIALDDKELGEVVRARLEGMKKVEAAFKKIEQYKSTPKQTDKENPAY